MIKANKLRIGNLFEVYDNVNRVDAVSEEKIRFKNSKGTFYVDPENINPIPLTPEILERCKLGDEISLYPYANSGFGIQIEGFTDQGINVSIKYLHQLQNAYFVLMDEELEIKELQNA